MIQNQNDYYYGQGKVYLASYNDAIKNWSWVGDVSSLKLNFTFEEKYSKRSIGGKLVNDKRFITFMGGNVTATWFERSLSNLKLVLRGKENTHRQSWHQEQVEDIKAGVSLFLKHQNVRNLSISGLKEDIDYKVNYLHGVVYFLVTSANKHLKIEYDYSAGNDISILNQEPKELMLRYEGINLANNQTVLVELFRLSITPVDSLNLLDEESSFSHIETELQLLPDSTRSTKSSLGLFGHIATLAEFALITYNEEINYDAKQDFAY